MRKAARYSRLIRCGLLCRLLVLGVLLREKACLPENEILNESERLFETEFQGID